MRPAFTAAILPRKRSTRLRLATTLVAMISSIVGAHPAKGAGETCMERARIVAALTERYGEEPTAIGLLGDGRMLELFVADKGRSWTIFATSPAGRSCVIGSGKHWIERKEGIPGLDASYAGN